MRDNWAVGYSQAYTVGVWVAFGGTEADLSEWFMQGTQQNQIAMYLIAASAYLISARGLKSLKNHLARITGPATGTIFALEPRHSAKPPAGRFAG